MADQKIITKKKFEDNRGGFLKGFCITLLAMFMLDFVFVGLGHTYPLAKILGFISFEITALLLLLMLVVVVYVMYLYSRLKVNGYGINPGKFFYGWLKDIMDQNNVPTVSALNEKSRCAAQTVCPESGNTKCRFALRRRYFYHGGTGFRK